MVQEKLNFDIANKYFSYDPETGILIWKITNNRKKAGDEAGLVHISDGSKVVTLFSKQYKYHRIAWLLHHGKWPDGVIDHINGIKTDNRISNLRDVSNLINAQNQRKAAKNNKTGYLGVSKRKRSVRWRASIKVNGLTKDLGTFATAEEAHQAYIVAKRQHHLGCTI